MKTTSILFAIGMAITVILLFVSLIWLSAEQSLSNYGAAQTDGPMLLFIICSFLLIAEVAIWLFIFQSKTEKKEDPRIHDIKRYGPIVLLPLLFLMSCEQRMEPPREPKNETAISVITMTEDTVLVLIVTPDDLMVSDFEKLLPPGARILEGQFSGKVAGPASDNKYKVKYTTIPETTITKYNDLNRYTSKFGTWTLCYERRGGAFTWGVRNELGLMDMLMRDPTIRFWELYDPTGSIAAEGEGNVDMSPYIMFHDEDLKNRWCESNDCD